MSFTRLVLCKNIYELAKTLIDNAIKKTNKILNCFDITRNIMKSFCFLIFDQENNYIDFFKLGYSL